MAAFGRLVMCEVYDADPFLLGSLGYVRNLLREAVVEAGFDVKDEIYRKTQEQYLVMLFFADGYIVVYGWPRNRSAMMNCYLPGEHDLLGICRYVAHRLGKNLRGFATCLKHPLSELYIPPVVHLGSGEDEL